jgi:formylglycine-generating enzyme required for sulfatase activity
MFHYFLLIFTFFSFAFMQTFEVQNVTASQRTDGSHIADVCYDLSPDDLFVSFRITSELSIDGGETWMGLNIPTQANIMGDNVLPGDNKCFEIALGSYLSDTYTSTAQVRVLAEGHEALELPFEMVEVASGEYMGEQWNPSGWGSFDEDTVKTIDYDFEIMKYEVTNAEYAAFLIEATANGYLDTGTECNSGSENSTPVGFLYPGETFISYWTGETYTLNSDPDQYGWCDYLLKFFDTPNNDWASQIYWNGTTFVISEGYGNHPVVSISYTGAWAFANYYGLRLPTKDEWLKAARGMNTWDTAYGPETGYDNPSNRANLRDSGDPFDNYGEYRRTTPVGFYNGEENEWGYETIDSPSPYGTYDQTGNVEEWTSTCSSGSPSMFVKGGNWNFFLHDTGSLNNSKATRSATSLGGSANGFRCVRTIVTSDNQETQTNIKTVK